MNIGNKWEKRYYISVVLLLAFTAAVKAMSIAQKEALFLLPDPLFSFLSTRVMLLGAIMMEITVGIILLKAWNTRVGVLSVLWLNSVFIAYRAAMSIIGYREPCWCFGRMYHWLGVKRELLDRAAIFILLYMTIGSLCCLVWRSWNKRRWNMDKDVSVEECSRLD